jgi:hypothetical protein
MSLAFRAKSSFAAGPDAAALNPRPYHANHVIWPAARLWAAEQSKCPLQFSLTPLLKALRMLQPPRPHQFFRTRQIAFVLLLSLW